MADCRAGRNLMGLSWIAILAAAVAVAARINPNPADPAENVRHDPCFWLNIYNSPDNREFEVDDDSTGKRITPVLPSQAAADSAREAICASRIDDVPR